MGIQESFTNLYISLESKQLLTSAFGKDGLLLSNAATLKTSIATFCCGK